MLDAASSMPGSPKRSSIERTLTFESFPCGPAGDTLTEKPRGPTRRIVQWVPDRATRQRLGEDLDPSWQRYPEPRFGGEAGVLRLAGPLLAGSGIGPSRQHGGDKWRYKLVAPIKKPRKMRGFLLEEGSGAAPRLGSEWQ